MCLHTNETNAKLAEEDIKVYKALASENRSIFQRFVYKPNTTYHLGFNLSIQEKEEDIRRLLGAYKCTSYALLVNQGFHSYITQPHENIINRGSATYDKIVEVFIPKGARYLEGVDDFGVPCYVSDQLRTGDLAPLESV